MRIEYVARRGAHHASPATHLSMVEPCLSAPYGRFRRNKPRSVAAQSRMSITLSPSVKQCPM